MPASKKTKKNTKTSLNPKLVAFLRKAGKPTKLKIVIFVLLFAGIGVILLRPSYAYAGYHPWNDPNNRQSTPNVGWSDWYIYNYGEAICGKTNHGYFLFGPYEDINVGPSGMDLTMGMAAFPDPLAPNPSPYDYRINISENNGQNNLATIDSGRTMNPVYISTGTHLGPGLHRRVEYRVASIVGTSCVKGYSIFTR